MKSVKNPEDRRNEILDAADELFAQKGFDNATTNDILERVGIARGTLYYHFKSKEDIMDALIARYSDRMLHAANAVGNDERIPVHERIVRVIMALNIQGDSGKEIIHHIHKPQNALMQQKMRKTVINGVTPILTKVIGQGVAQGLFNTPYPYECMEMVVIYAHTVFDGDTVELTDETRMERILAFVFHLERLLGVKNGSLKYVLNLFGEDLTDDKQ